MVGCQSTEQSLAPFNDDTLAGYEQRHATTAPGTETIADYPKVENRRPSLVAGSLTTTQPSVAQTLEYQMPDPSVAAQVFEERTRHIADERRAKDYRRVCAKAVQHLEGLKRPAQIKLSLAEVVRRTVANSYSIKVAGYDPAISTAQIVEAEAQFDATFYANWLSVIQDQPTASALQANNNKAQTAGSGIRKLLSTGTLVDVSFNYQRTKSTLPFQTLNPSINNDLTLKMQQPLLQGFGLDFNRAQINIRKAERAINTETFRQKVIEAVYNAEVGGYMTPDPTDLAAMLSGVYNNPITGYWGLVSLRRTVTILAELLAETEETYRYIEARRDFDAFAVLIANSKSAADQARVELIKAVAAVKEAEDKLKRLMNDPDLTMARDIEIIPVDIPEAVPIVVDPLAEMQTALDQRPDLKVAHLAIEKARIYVGAAKNQALPKFDAVFTYKILGLGGNESDAFEQTMDNRFNEYDVGVQFEWPIGSRKARAALRSAKLQYEKAIAQQKGSIEQVLLEVNMAVRGIRRDLEAIRPAIDATIAAEENVRATKERAERKSPAELQTELSGQQQLARARQTLLQTVVSYNKALLDLEKSKGTLLGYNNIVIAEPAD